jgi:chaperonin GroES
MIRPLQNYAIIKGEEEKVGETMVLPEAIRNQFPEQGEVIAVGPGKLLDDGNVRPAIVEVGQKVLFKKYAADKVKIEDKEYLILEDTDIIGIV